MNTINELVERYLAIWNETDTDARQALIARTWTEDASYVDPMLAAEGHDGIDAMVEGFQAQFPGLAFRPVGDVEAHHDRVRFRWELTPAGADTVIAAGTDVAVVRDGRLQAVTGFFDQAPVLEGV